MDARYSAPAWGVSPFADLDVPSGGKIQARRLDLQILVETDLIEEMDMISSSLNENVVQPANGRGKKPADRPQKKLTKKQQADLEEQQAKEMLTGDSFKTIAKLLNRLIPAVVVQPKISSSMHKADLENGSSEWQTIDPADRDEDAIDPDQVPLGDQVFIMNWCMEGMDLEAVSNFREQSGENVGDVEDEPGVRDAAE